MLILNGTLLTMAPDMPLIQPGAVAIRQGRIIDIGASSDIAVRYPDQNIIDAAGKLVMPGLICAHTHFYGAFARGMTIPGAPPARFKQILERLWWRLDKALDEESIEFSALVCLIDAIKHGTTTLIDHHASPHCIDGSLDIIAQAVRRAGVRAGLCYEVTDRDGPECARAGIRENERFARQVAHAPDGQIAASFGLHASMTLGAETLATCAGRAADLGIGCHIHVAEGKADVQDSRQKYGCRVVERLARARILNDKTIAAHCIHLDEREHVLLWQTQTNIVHNPRSNMNNAVGCADLPGMLARGLQPGLGNDGFSNNMFTEIHTAYLLHKHATQDPRTLPADRIIQIAFGHNAAIAARVGLPHHLGVLKRHAPADMIIVDYRPTTPLTAQNAPWHIVFGVDGSNVETTIVGGRVLMRQRQLVTLDEAEITHRSRQAAKKMWERIA